VVGYRQKFLGYGNPNITQVQIERLPTIAELMISHYPTISQQFLGFKKLSFLRLYEKYLKFRYVDEILKI